MKKRKIIIGIGMMPMLAMSVLAIKTNNKAIKNIVSKNDTNNHSQKDIKNLYLESKNSKRNTALNLKELKSQKNIFSNIVHNNVENKNHKFVFTNLSKEKVSYKIADAAASTKVTAGGASKIFEDSDGTLWLFAYGIGLRRSLDGVNWTEADSSSNFTKGYKGDMIEDSNGTLWSMGNNSTLQYSKDKVTWKDADSSSNIIYGAAGKLYQDSKNTLWSVGYNSKLQYSTDGVHWQLANTKEDIEGGEYPTIFEDSRGRLWSMGKKALQYTDDGIKWELAKNSNITNGSKGMFFEDSRGTLWSSGTGTGIQYSTDGLNWISAVSKTNITDGNNAWMFEDRSGKLWLSGKNSKLQYSTDGINWNLSNGSSKIINPSMGKMIQLPNGDLITGGFRSDLQYSTDGITWTLNKTILWDSAVDLLHYKSNGIAWSSGGGRRLQFSITNGRSWYNSGSTNLPKEISLAHKYNVEIKQFNLKDKSTILFDGYNWGGDLKRSHLKYKKNNEQDSSYKNLVLAKGENLDLASDTYNFKWVLGTDENASTDFSTDVFDIKTEKLEVLDNSASKNYIDDGNMTISKGINSNSEIKLQYTNKTSPSEADWIDIDGSVLKSVGLGKIKLRWKPKNNGVFDDYSTGKDAGSFDVISSPENIKTNIVNPSYKGAGDGQISITSKIPTDSTLEYSNNNGTTWNNVPSSKIITKLSKSSLVFRATPKSDAYYLDSSKLKNLGTVVIPDGTNIPIPTIEPLYEVTAISHTGSNDGKIKVSGFQNTYSKLQYSKDGSLNFENVPSDGIISGLDTGTFAFRWVGKLGETYTDGSTFQSVKNINIASSFFVPLPSNATLKVLNHQSQKGINDGKVEVTNFEDDFSKLQYSIGGNAFSDVTATGEISGIKPGEVQFKWIPKDNNKKYTDNSTQQPAGKVVIIESNIIAIPIDPTFAITTETTKDATDATITLNSITDSYSTLKYSEDGITFKDATTTISGLKAGEVQFKWVPKLSTDKYTDSTKVHQVATQTINASTKIDESKLPTPIFTSTKPSYRDAKDGKITVGNSFDLYSKLQYSTDGSSFSDIPSTNIIDKLEDGDIEFRWVPNISTEKYSDTSSHQKINKVTLSDPAIITIPKNPTYASTDETAANKKDGTITVLTNHTDAHSNLEYSVDQRKTWTAVPSNNKITGLEHGVVNFQWKPITPGDKYTDGTNFKSAWNVTTNGSNKIGSVPDVTYTISKAPSAKDQNDAEITVNVIGDSLSKLQYSTDNKLSYTDVPVGGKISNLGSGLVTFQWLAKADGNVYADGTNSKFANDKFIDETFNKIIDPANTPNFVSTSTTLKGNNDGKIKVTNANDKYSELYYSVDGLSYILVPSNGEITNLKSGNVSFQWQGKLDEEYVTSGKTFKVVGSEIVTDSNDISDPNSPIINAKIDSSKGGQDGKIILENYENEFSKLQYKHGSSGSFTDVPNTGIIEGLAKNNSNENVSFQWVPKDIKDSYQSNSTKIFGINITTIIGESDKIAIPHHPNYVVTQNTGLNNNSIEVLKATDPYSELQYSIGEQNNYTTIKADSSTGKYIIGNLGRTIVHFRWIPKSTSPATVYYSDGRISQNAWNVSTESTNQLVDADYPDASIQKHVLQSARGVSDSELFIQSTITGHNAKLQYSTDNKDSYTDVPADGIIKNLPSGPVTFQWLTLYVSDKFSDGTNSKYAGTYEIPQADKIVVPEDVTFKTNQPTLLNNKDGEITISNIPNKNADLYYSPDNGVTWTEVTSSPISSLSSGKVNFKWVAKEGLTFKDGSTEKKVEDQEVPVSTIIDVPTQHPIFTQNAPSWKGHDDGTIEATGWNKNLYDLEYSIDNGNTFSLLDSSGIVQGLKKGEVKFQLVPKSPFSHFSNNQKNHLVGSSVVAESNDIGIPKHPRFKFIEGKADDKKDSQLQLSDYKDDYSQLQYSTDNSTFINVSESGLIENVDPSEKVYFQWVSKNQDLHKYFDGKEAQEVNFWELKRNDNSLGWKSILGITLGSILGVGILALIIAKIIKVKKSKK